jgi:aminoglycoside phosphotransferase (APT) family kinase protein
MGTPPAEVEIDAPLARSLLEDQHPDLADLPLELADTGWDNATFRLGGALALRLPRRALAAPLLLNEQRWLPLLQPRLPLPIPAPVRTGRPGPGYPWAWSVVPWLEGMPADLAPPGADQAEPLAAFLRALHVEAPADAPANPVRGVALASRAEGVEARLDRLRRMTSLITSEVDRAWRRALEAPEGGERTWIHGDPHARNVLVKEDVISGVIDWGDLAAGDRASDLASIWMLLPTPASRARAIEAYGAADEALWVRARGWAVLLGAVLLETGLEDHPRHAAMGETTLRRICEDGVS